MVKEKEPKTTKKTAKPKEKKKPAAPKGASLAPVEEREPKGVKKAAHEREKVVEEKETPALQESSVEAHSKSSPQAVEAEVGLPETDQDDKSKKERYFEAVGRRKTSVARTRLYTKPGEFLVNEKLYSVYFPTIDLQKIVEDALQKMKLFG